MNVAAVYYFNDLRELVLVPTVHTPLVFDLRA